MINKIRSFLFDKRLPHFFPYTLLYKLLTKVEIVEPEKILLSLTFDIEYHQSIEKNYLKNFFQNFKNFLKKTRSTLFVCGETIEEVARELKKLQKNCELGLHGYKHELWGDEKWWLNKKPIDKKTKIKLIKLSFEEFKRNKLKKPISFRAPYMISNKETLEILNSFGFKVDSSNCTYLSKDTLPSKYKKMIRIPVSVNPIPTFKKRFLIPFSFYKIFNMENFYAFEKNDILEFVKIVTSFQQANDIRPHLVFLAHPWEFVRVKNLGYCSPKNYSILEKMINILKENYRIKFLKIVELSKEVFE